MDVRHLADGEFPEAARLFGQAIEFSWPDVVPDAFGPMMHLDRSLGAWVDGRMVGVTCGFASRLVLPGGVAVPALAVSMVGVLPNHRGAGVGREILERQLHEAREAGEAAAALYASGHNVYGRYGYGVATTTVGTRIQARDLRLRDDAPTSDGRVEQIEIDDARQVLPDVYTAVFGSHPGEMDRHPGWWETRLADHPELRHGASPLRTIVHRRAHGTVDGAMTYRATHAMNHNEILTEIAVVDVVGADPAARLALWRWFGELALTGPVSQRHADPEDPLWLALHNPRALHVTDVFEDLWIRVLDVPAVIGARAAGTPGAVTVTVRDPLLGDATYRVAADDDLALRAQVAGDRPAALVVPVDQLAPLVMGTVSASRLAAAGRIEVRDPAALPRVDRMFTSPQRAWCSTGF